MDYFPFFLYNFIKKLKILIFRQVYSQLNPHINNSRSMICCLFFVLILLFWTIVFAGVFLAMLPAMINILGFVVLIGSIYVLIETNRRKN